MIPTAIVAFTIIVIIFYIFRKRNQIKPRQTYAVEIDQFENIYVNFDCVNEGLKDYRTLNVQTVYEVIKHGVSLSAKKPLFCYRTSSDDQFQNYTYEQVFNTMHEVGSGIIHLGFKPSNDTFIGIYASTNVHYAMFLYSLCSFSFVSIGLYDSVGKDGLNFIIAHAELQIIFADELERVRKLLEWKQNDTWTLKLIISLLEPTDDLRQLAKQKQTKLISYDQLVKYGQQNRHEPVPPKPNDTAIVMYTSGSTGEPKGCVITHEQIICSVVGMSTAAGIISLTGDKVPRVLNFMPLAHLFGYMTCICVTFVGGTIGFWQGSVVKLMDDFRDFKPTILPIVPRLLNKLYDKVMSETTKKGFLTRALVQLAIRRKLAEIRRNNLKQNTIWDYLVFNKIRKNFGGQVDRVVCGSAPLLSDVADFTRAMFSCIFIEAYGQTECIVGCWQTAKDVPGYSDIGIPTTVNYLKLIDVHEKQYYTKNGVGEICIKSGAVFKCYLKDEEQTRKTIDEQGWLHTGDIGEWTKNNRLKIVDRKKNILKLSQGEYIAPEKIENVYSRSSFVNQIYIYGNSYQNFPVALVVLDDDYVQKWIKDKNIINVNLHNELIKNAILKELHERGKMNDLMSYEQVKNIAVI
ncbi:unnamed protein product, partial [Didymodactylos carnosus]